MTSIFNNFTLLCTRNIHETFYDSLKIFNCWISNYLRRQKLGALSHCLKIVTKSLVLQQDNWRRFLRILSLDKTQYIRNLYLILSHQLVLKIEMKVSSIGYCFLFITLILMSQGTTEGYINSQSWVLRASCLEIPTGNRIWKLLGCDQKKKLKVDMVPQLYYLLRFWNTKRNAYIVFQYFIQVQVRCNWHLQAKCVLSAFQLLSWSI